MGGMFPQLLSKTKLAVLTPLYKFNCLNGHLSLELIRALAKGSRIILLNCFMFCENEDFKNM